MLTALTDLALDHLWVVYPGVHRYPLHEKITAVPLFDIPATAQPDAPDGVAGGPA
jgi:hypothetical protein